MAQFSRTWWGKRFIEALEKFTDSGRLGRGRAYANNGKVKEHQIKDGKVTAKVRGSVNAYFGVTKEPTYTVSIEIKTISAADWSKIIAKLGTKGKCPIVYGRSRVLVVGVKSLSTVGISDGYFVPRRAA
jgi:uncharacterized Zn finger protein